jgi:hypothetical protein
VSGEDLEGKCEETRITASLRQSTSGIPIVRDEEGLLVEERTRPPAEQIIVDDDSPADSRIYGNVGNPPPQQQIEQIAIHAPLGDGKFWLWVHLKLVAYALQKLSVDKEIAEARGELLEANVAREYRGRRATEQELGKTKLLLELREYALASATFALFEESDKSEDLQSQLTKLQEKLNQYEEERTGLYVAALRASNDAEAKEVIIKMYEQRFGSREKLLRLATAEQKCEDKNRPCRREDYACIDKLIQYHEVGRCPKTVGERIARAFEKLASPTTYYKIARAILYAFRKEK